MRRIGARAAALAPDASGQAGQGPVIVAPAHCGCELLAIVVPSIVTVDAAAKIAPPLAALFHVIDPLCSEAVEPFSAASPPPLPPVPLAPPPLPEPPAPVALPVSAEPSNDRRPAAGKEPPPAPPLP